MLLEKLKTIFNVKNYNHVYCNVKNNNHNHVYCDVSIICLSSTVHTLLRFKFRLQD